MAASEGIVIEDLSMTYRRGRRQTVALEGVDLRADAGQWVSLLGPSGCGKSTVLRILADLVAPTSGTASLGGMSPAEARRTHAYALVSQQSSMLAWRTLADNVGLGLEVARVPRAERRRRIDEALELVGLTEFAKAYPRELSGGMRQRGAIARALALRPRFLLMDEPFGALDELTRERLNFELLSILEESGTSLLLITHSISEAVILSDVVAVMSGRPGRIIHEEPIPFGRHRTRSIRSDATFVQIEAQLRDRLDVSESDPGRVEERVT